MIPGTILYHKNFNFSDGAKGNKLLVLLSDLVDGRFYIAAKTTSIDKRKGKIAGCQHNDVYPNFFIPKGTSSFLIDTWVGLDEFFELEGTALIQRHFSGDIQSKGTLENFLTKDLLACVLKSKDITSHQEAVVIRVLEKFP